MLTHLKQVPGAGVGDGDNPGLRRQGLQPVGETVLRVLPVLRRGFQPLIDHATVFLPRDQPTKGILALCRPALAAGGRQAVKGKTVDAFLLQMHKGALDQRIVIGGDIVHRRIVLGLVVGTADADNRDADIGKLVDNTVVVIVGDHPVAEPLLDIVDTGAKIFFDKDIPLRLRGLQILAHALDDLTVIGFIGIE